MFTHYLEILLAHLLNSEMKNKVTQQAIKDIKILISDVDGVLTDGTISLGSDGTEFKRFSVEDGAGAAYARLAGIPIALISGRFSLCTSRRAAEMGIKHCYQGKLNKLDAYNEILDIYKLKDKNVAYIGDGLIDIPILSKVGLPCTVPNAHKKVLSVSDFITTKEGGDGAFREVVEMILDGKGIYDKIYNEMSQQIYKA